MEPQNSSRVQATNRWSGWLPSRGNALFTLLVSAMVIFASNVGILHGAALAGGSTGTISYQGRLADANGAPLTGTYPMIFRAYSAASGGTSVWEEQWTGPNSVAISDGLFNVMLGSLTPIPPEVITRNTSVWLGVTVGTDDEMTPRVQFGSVPYAVQALTVPDGSVTDAKLANSAITTVKLGDSAVTTAKLADGSVTAAKLGGDITLTPPDGSITTAKLADSAVTSSKIKLQSGLVRAGTDVSPPVGTAVDVPGTTQTIVVDTPQILMVFLTADITAANSTLASAELMVDGVYPTGTGAGFGPGVTSRAYVSQQYYVPLAVGTHTIKLTASNHGPGAATIYGYHTNYMYMLISQ